MKKNNLIFVYGTLRREFPNKSINISKYGQLLENGFVYGKLYLIDDYPGLTLDKTNANRVFGEIYKVNNIDILLKELDLYEECSSAFPTPHEYKRKIVTTYSLSNSSVYYCWCYIYNKPVKKFPRIQSGDFIKI